MKMFGASRWVLRGVLVAVLACLCASRGDSQNPNLKPAYGSVTLEAGFPNDPVMVKVDAGGPVQTNRGGVTAWVANPPDYVLNYKAGTFALTIYAECEDADTTLLVNLPNGKWVANDDGPNTGLNPLLKFTNPQSGRYDIWVGTLNKGGTPPARLYITELK